MALLGNRSVLLKSPGRYFGGSTVSDNRSNFGTPGSTRGRFVGAFQSTSATPRGYRPPYSWIIAIKNGDMASVNNLAGSASINLTMVSGVNGAATLEGQGNVTQAIGQLVVSMVATLAGTGTASAADLKAYLNAVATLSGSGSINAAPMAALAWAQAAVTGGGSISNATPYATGTLNSLIKGYSSLTPEGIRDLVWGALLVQYPDAGTAGKALSTASSGGVDLNALAQAVLDKLNLNTIPVDVKKMNGAEVLGSGVASDKWRGE